MKPRGSIKRLRKRYVEMGMKRLKNAGGKLVLKRRVVRKVSKKEIKNCKGVVKFLMAMVNTEESVLPRGVKP